MAQGKVKIGGGSKLPAHQKRKQAPIKSKIDNFYKKKNVNVTKVFPYLSLLLDFRKSTRTLKTS